MNPWITLLNHSELSLVFIIMSNGIVNGNVIMVHHLFKLVTWCEIVSWLFSYILCSQTVHMTFPVCSQTIHLTFSWYTFPGNSIWFFPWYVFPDSPPDFFFPWYSQTIHLFPWYAFPDNPPDFFHDIFPDNSSNLCMACIPRKLSLVFIKVCVPRQSILHFPWYVPRQFIFFHGVHSQIVPSAFSHSMSSQTAHLAFPMIWCSQTVHIIFLPAVMYSLFNWLKILQCDMFSDS